MTTALLAGAACFTIYFLLKTKLDTNIPVLFFLVMAGYANAVEGGVPIWIVYLGLMLALILRFEFMNPSLAKVVKAAELVILAVIIYHCSGSLF